MLMIAHLIKLFLQQARNRSGEALSMYLAIEKVLMVGLEIEAPALAAVALAGFESAPSDSSSAFLVTWFQPLILISPGSPVGFWLWYLTTSVPYWNLICSVGPCSSPIS